MNANLKTPAVKNLPRDAAAILAPKELHPLWKAFLLACLNMGAFLFLRLADVAHSLSWDRAVTALQASGIHIVILWTVGMLMLVLLGLIAGKLSLPRSWFMRGMLLGRR